jgi:phosphoribosylformylglycinamidine cyclo-ligase
MPEPPPVFSEIQEKGEVDKEEMYRTFNMGIGFVIIVDEEVEKDVLDILGGEASTLGVVQEEKGVHVSNLDLEL